MLISILICTLQSREHFFNRVYTNLTNQIRQHGLEHEVEIVIDKDNGQKLVGKKRNDLVEKAKGKYICFVDDDDDVSPFYVNSVYKACQQDRDCCSLIGMISIDGKQGKRFTHSIRFKDYFEQNREYYRPPNHLNAIKKEIAEKFKFPEKNFGEDTDWAMQVCRAGVLKTEATIPVPIYFYLYRSQK